MIVRKTRGFAHKKVDIRYSGAFTHKHKPVHLLFNVNSDKLLCIS